VSNTDLQITSLEPFGVAIAGVDLRDDLSPETQAELARLYEEHYLLVFKAQALENDDHVKTMAIFGPILDEQEDGTYTCFVSNVDEKAFLPGGLELLFHADHTYTPRGPWGTSLYAIEAEGDVVPTRFVNLERVYLALPSDLQERLEGLTATDMVDYGGAYEDLYTPLKQLLPPSANLENLAPDRYVRNTHPVAPPHPRTGRQQLYVSEQLTVWIEELERADSNQLLDELFQTMYDESNIYEHNWDVGDLVVWDQFGVQHARPDIKPESRRVLRRAATGLYTHRQLVDTSHFELLTKR